MPIPVNSGAEARKLRKAPKKKASPAPASRSDAAQRTGARTPKPKPAPKPTRRQVVQAKQQERQYESQGRAVEKQATRKTRIRKRREARVRGKSDAAQGNQTRAAEAYKRTPEYKKIQQEVFLKHGFERAKKKTQLGNAPVMKVLEQTTRPVHAIAAGTKAGIKGESVPKAALKGAKLEDKTLFSDVLKEAGVEKLPGGKTIASVAGFGLDVALDPTTYVTGGTGSIAKKAAASAARKAEKKATAAGLSKEQSQRMGERAAKQTLRKTSDARGVTLRVAGKEVPKVREASAKAGRAAGRVIRKATPEKARAGARRVVAEVRPTIRPDVAVPRAERREIRRAARTTRYSTSREVEKTTLKARALKRQLKGRDKEVLDAIEAGRVRDLPDDLRPIAKRLSDQFKYARRLERRAGIPVKNRKNYVPHALREEMKKGEGITSTGVRDPKGSFQKQRKEQRTLKEIRQTDPGKYSEDAPLLYANRVSEGVRTVKKADLNRRLMDMGRTLKRGSTQPPKTGEQVYHIKGARIREPDAEEVARFLEKGDAGRGGRYVVLNKATVDEALKVVRAPERSTIGTYFDYGQGKWKWAATQPNPGFHLRNLVGDTMNAYLAESVPQLARNIRQSRRALKRLNKQEKALLVGRIADSDGKGLKINGHQVSYGDLIKEAEGVGAVRAGFTGRELSDLATTTEGIKKIKGRFKGTKAQRASQALKNREDVLRLATYIGGRKRGLSPEKAAERSAKYHFDYADLTEFERRVARRVMPFYTFSSRNIPLQFQTLLTRPGKYAQYEKLREEIAKAFDVDLDAVELDLAPQEQRSAPMVVKWKGQQFSLSFGPSGLPMTDLNEFPTTTNPVKQADEWMERAMSMVTPAAKTPVELWANVSFFFRDQIERETGPLVPAPSIVAGFPEPLRKKLGIVPDYVDKQTGKKSWGWPAKVDYVSHQLPGPANYLNRLLTPSERKNQSMAAKTVGYVGLRSVPVDATGTRIQETYEKRAELGKKLASLRQRKNPRNDMPISADNATPEYTKILQEYSKLDKALSGLRTKRGDVIVPTRGRPSEPAKPKVRKAPSDGSGLRLNDYSGSSGGSSGSSGGGFSISSY